MSFWSEPEQHLFSQNMPCNKYILSFELRISDIDGTQHADKEVEREHRFAPRGGIPHGLDCRKQ